SAASDRSECPTNSTDAGAVCAPTVNAGIRLDFGHESRALASVRGDDAAPGRLRILSVRVRTGCPPRARLERDGTRGDVKRERASHRILRLAQSCRVSLRLARRTRPTGGSRVRQGFGRRTLPRPFTAGNHKNRLRLILAASGVGHRRAALEPLFPVAPPKA